MKKGKEETSTFTKILRYFHLTESFTEKRHVLNVYDCMIALFIFFLGLCLRLFNFQIPNQICFDEVHFVKFINHYMKGEFYFDIHPPLAKILLYELVKLIGYDGSYSVEDTNTPKKHPFYCYMRMIPAFFGAGVGPMIYFALRVINVNIELSITGAMLATFDLCLICESKYILTDGILHFFAALAIFTSLYLDSFELYSSQWWLWLILSSASTGCVVSCKHTALGLPCFTFMLHCFATVKNQSFIFDIYTIREFLTRMSVFMATVVIVYYSCFVVHINLLPNHHPDGVYVPEEFENTLLKPGQDPSTVGHMSLFRKFTEYNLLMIENNMKIDNYHPFASEWWTWPLMLSHGCLFWENKNRHVWSMGNPFVWWLSTFGLLTGFICIVIGRIEAPRLCAVIGAWCTSYFPFSLVPRAMWSYHYAIPLIFSMLSLIISVDSISNEKIQKYCSRGILFLTITGFLWIGPVVYGIPVDNYDMILPFKAWKTSNNR